MKFSHLSSHILRHFSIASIALISTAIAIAKPAQAASFTIKIDPAATYLHTATNDLAALDAVAIDLGSLGISSGDFITLEQVGDLSYWAPVGSPEVGKLMIGLFSTSAELLPNQSHRVPGAIEFGNDVNTTLINYVDNDISEDFLIYPGPIHLKVPDLATFLFVSAKDRYWGDNRDFDNDYALKITTKKSVPEPSTILGLLVLGGLASKGFCRKNSNSIY